MKTLTAALLATAFAATPALACSWNKDVTAEVETPQTVASAEMTIAPAMSTYDPAKLPAYEVEAEKVVTEEAAD